MSEQDQFKYRDQKNQSYPSLLLTELDSTQLTNTLIIKILFRFISSEDLKGPKS